MKFILFLLASIFSFSNCFSQISGNMVLLENLDDYFSYSACWGYTAPDGREYAILGAWNGTSFVDITDDADIHEVGFVPGGISSWREMKTYSHYCYIVSEYSNSGVQVVDLQYLPDSVHLVYTFYFPGYGNTHSISQSGPYLYLNGGNYGAGGISILDLTVNPAVPVKRGEWENSYVHDSRIVNNTIWACNIYDGEISVINASNKDNPFTITSFMNLPDPFPHNCALTEDGKYILTTDETQFPPGSLKIWNIEDIEDIYYMYTWRPPGNNSSIVHNVEIYGDTAYIAHYTAGVRVLDISNIFNAVEIGYYDTYPEDNGSNFQGCWAVYKFPSGRIIASDIQTGLYVLELEGSIGINNISSLAGEYRLHQNYPNPFNPVTTIKFEIPESGHVGIFIYNTAGEKVADLVNERMSAGTYEILFDGKDYPSGVYYYRMMTEKASVTKKLLLVK